MYKKKKTQESKLIMSVPHKTTKPPNKNVVAVPVSSQS